MTNRYSLLKTKAMTHFKSVPEGVPDPILSINALFNADKNPKKVSLGVGAYRDDDGKPWILPSVQTATKHIQENQDQYNHEYPPLTGETGFLHVAQQLLLGEDNVRIAQHQVASAQALSGTGSIYILFQLIKQYYPNREMYLPDITWPNHYGIYERVFRNKDYKLYSHLCDGELKLNIKGILDKMNTAQEGSIFLFHSCSHNPTGIDPNQLEWHQILQATISRKHLIVFDNAYQGFASGSFELDGYAIRLFADSGIELMVAQSFAKNFGLYGQRIGCAHVIHNGDQRLNDNIQAALGAIIRSTWSMSPVYGAQLVEIIGNNKTLKQQFLKDIETMSSRMNHMRHALREELTRIKAQGRWNHITESIGMFCFTGLKPHHVEYLQQKCSIYMAKNGRLSICGLTTANVPYIAQSIKEALENAQ